MVGADGSSRTAQYLTEIGVRPTPRATCPFDPGYDPATLEGHIEQSGHLMATLKISMACWMVADEAATRRKIQSATRVGIPAVAGGGPIRDGSSPAGAAFLSRPVRGRGSHAHRVR